MIAMPQRTLLGCFLLALAYFATGKLGLLVPYFASDIPLISLTGGIALAALLRCGIRYWPGVLLGSILLSLPLASNSAAALGIAAANTLGPVIASVFLQRLGFSPAFVRLRHIVFFAAAAALAALISSGGGNVNLILAEFMPSGQMQLSWLRFWSGEFIGIIVVTPLLLAVSLSDLHRLWQRRRAFAACLAASGILSWGIFCLNDRTPGGPIPLAFTLQAVVLWSTVSFGLIGSSLGLLLPIAIAILTTHQDLGPLHRADDYQNVLLLWIYLSSLIFMQLLVVTFEARRRLAQSKLLRRSQILALRSNILERIDLRQPLQEILEALARQVEILLPDALCSILLLDSKRKQFGSCTAPSLPKFYHDAFEGLAVAEDVCVCGAAAFTGRRTIVDNLAEHPFSKPIRDVTMRANLAACCAQPIFDRRSQVIGTFALYRQRTGTPEPEELALIDNAVYTAALAIERSHKEEPLQTSEDKFHALYRYALDGIMLLDPEQGFVAANPAMLLLLNLGDEQELISRKPEQFSPLLQPDGQPSKQKADAVINNALSAGSHFFEWIYQRRGGTTFPADVQLGRIELDGRILLQGHVRDITSQKREKEDLRIAATAFETREGIIITDSNNRIIRTNEAFTRLTGYTAEEALGQTPALLKSGRQSDEFYRNMWQTLERNRHWEGEIWNRRKNGEVYAQWLTIAAITDNDGKISNYVAGFSDISQLKQNEAEIHALAFYDPLTDLPNRRLLHERLKHAQALSQRTRQHGALIFLDLDHFKTLNDTQGHAIGDRLLIETAQRLQAVVRETDTVARLAGDEFVAMLEDLSEDPIEAAAHVRTIAEKISKALAVPYLLPSDPDQFEKIIEHHSSASIGVTLFRNDDVDELMKRADMAMYQAKRSGRNAIRFFDPLMQSTLHDRAELENDLRLALDNEEFCLHYQLQVDADGRPTSAEALLRWQQPQRGNLLPGQFIPLAEETGMISAIGSWVLLQACKTLARWADIPEMRHLQLAVNISPRQFRQADFVEQVQAALHSAGANPAQLKLEITENLVMHNIDDSIDKISTIKQAGVTFTMDDFGTGYSSLSYLQRLPLEQLKIDRSFICNLPEDSQAASTVRTIITLGKSLDITIIAEGVESEQQHAYLAEQGCPIFQGFLYAKPMPLTEFEAFIRSSILGAIFHQPAVPLN